MIDEREPTRLDAGDGHASFLGEALREARADRPGAPDLAGLASRLGAATGVPISPPSATPPATGSSTVGAGASTAWWAGATTKIGVGVLLVAAGGAVYFASTARSAPNEAPRVGASSSPSAHIAAREVPPPIASSGVEVPARAIAAAAEPRPGPTASAPATIPRASASGSSAAAPDAVPSSLERPEPEAAILERARAQLATSPATALSTTEHHARSFPRGVLSQEREVVAIDALLRLGRRADAVARVDAFRARHPASAYLRRLDRLIEGDARDQNRPP
jgi:hypothetical protein